MKNLLIIFMVLLLFNCSKEDQLVTYNVECSGNYYVKYSNHDISLFVKTDTLSGDWNYSVSPDYTREHVVKIFPVDTIPATVSVSIYLNGIHEGSVNCEMDSIPIRYGIMLREF